MEAEILFPEILCFGIQIEKKEIKISRAKIRRLKKKARRVLSIREDDGVVQSVNQSAEGLSLCFDGLSLVTRVDIAVKKWKSEPFQMSDVLPVVEDEDSVDKLSDVLPVEDEDSFDNLSDVLPAVEDEDTVDKLSDVLPVEDEDSIDKLSDVLPVEDKDSVRRKSVSPSEQLSPLVAVHFIEADNSSLPPCLPNSISTSLQASTVPPGSFLFDDEEPLCSNVHYSAETQFEAISKQARDGINIESGIGLVTPRLKRKSRSKSIVDGHRYNFRSRLKKD